MANWEHPDMAAFVRQWEAREQPERQFELPARVWLGWWPEGLEVVEQWDQQANQWVPVRIVPPKAREPGPDSECAGE